MISRRSLFRSLGALLAAPPIAKITALIPAVEAGRIRSLNYLRYQELAREAAHRFVNTNSFLASVSNEFDKSDAKVGQQLRIRLPTDYRLS